MLESRRPGAKVGIQPGLCLRLAACAPSAVSISVVVFSEMPGWGSPAHGPLDQAGPGWGMPAYGVELYVIAAAIGLLSIWLCASFRAPLKRQGAAALGISFAAFPWCIATLCCWAGPYVHPGFALLSTLTSALPPLVIRGWRTGSTGWPPRSPIVVVLALFVAGLLGLCEVGLRATMPPSIRGLPSVNAMDDRFWHFDPTREVERHGVTYQFSAEGHRTAHPSNHAETQILLLGDSIPFGGGFPLEMTYPKRAEQHLVAEGRSVRIANAGIPAFSLEQIRHYYESAFEATPHDWVVLSFYIDDINRAARFKRDDRLFSPLWPKWMQHLHHESQLWRMLSNAAGVEASHFIAPRRLGYAESWPSALEELSALEALVAQRDAKLVIFNIPYFTWSGSLAEEADYAFITYDRALSAWCRKADIPLRSILPVMAPMQIESLRMGARDIHLNAEGHRVVGAALGVWLDELLEAQPAATLP